MVSWQRIVYVNKYIDSDKSGIDGRHHSNSSTGFEFEPYSFASVAVTCGFTILMVVSYKQLQYYSMNNISELVNGAIRTMLKCTTTNRKQSANLNNLYKRQIRRLQRSFNRGSPVAYRSGNSITNIDPGQLEILM
jgi:hypothetical protein